MDDETFDAVTQRLSGLLSRRHSLGALAALGLGGGLLSGDATAKKKRKKKKKHKKGRGDCGTCPPHATCNEQGTDCTCTTGFRPCGKSCIATTDCCTRGVLGCAQGLTCCRGTCQECCGSDASACPAVPPDATCKVQRCQDGTCGLINSPNGQPDNTCVAPQVCQAGVCTGCETPGTCPSAPVCKVATCTGEQCGTANATNGPAPGCPSPGCCNGACCTGSQVCFNTSCCQPTSTCPANYCGPVSDGCGGQRHCTCPASQVCSNQASDGDCQCAVGLICGSSCCTGSQVCVNGSCCTPENQGATCAGKCGNVANTCGQVVNCGACPG